MFHWTLLQLDVNILGPSYQISSKIWDKPIDERVLKTGLENMAVIEQYVVSQMVETKFPSVVLCACLVLHRSSVLKRCPMLCWNGSLS